MEMSYNARHAFRKVTLRIASKLNPIDFQGPIIKKSHRYKNENIYKWYKLLPFKDTAWVNVYVSRFRFRSPDITMSNSINYLTRKPHNLYEVFPLCEKNSLKFNEDSFNQLTICPTFDELISKDKLIIIMQEGFYDVVKVNQDLTFLVFWEPLGIIHSENEKIETSYSTLGLDDQCQVTLKPFLLPDSIKNYLVLKEDGYHYLPELK